MTTPAISPESENHHCHHGRQTRALRALVSRLSVLSVMLTAGGGAHGIDRPGGVNVAPKGVDESDWNSIRMAYEAERHALRGVGGNWEAHDPRQQWHTTFEGRGFTMMKSLRRRRCGLFSLASVQ